MRLLILIGLMFGQVDSGKEAKVTVLDSLEPLRTQFNSDAGKPRLVALLSPT